MVQDGRGKIALAHARDARDEQTRAENARTLKLLVHCLPAETMIRVLEGFVHGFLESRGLLWAREDIVKHP
jgi:hypothetical protein